MTPVTPDLFPEIRIHHLRTDALVRSLVEYRQALELLSMRTPPGAEPLLEFMHRAVEEMEQELIARGVRL